MNPTSIKQLLFAPNFPNFFDMLSNYYTLSLIARDLNEKMSGSTIEQVFSQSKNELVLAASGGHVLVVSCEPSMNCLYLRSSYSRAKKNTVDLFPRLIGSVIRSISLHRSDRELKIGTDRALEILIRVYGSKANVLLVDPQRVIQDSFLHPKENIATAAAEITYIRPFPADPEDFRAQLTRIGHLSAFAAVKAVMPLMGSLLIRELFARSGVSEEAFAVEAASAHARTLHDQAKTLLAELSESPLPRIYKEGAHPVRFSIIGLRQLQGLEAEQFDSVHQAIRTFISSSHRERSFHTERDQMTARLKSEKERIERTTAKITAEEKESADRAALYELRGKLLMANLHLVRREDEIVKFENVFSPQREEIEIPLDPQISPAKNAEKYFGKSRKARGSLDNQEGHKQEYRDRYDEVVRLLAALEQVQTPEQWKEFAAANAKDSGGKGASKKEPAPFRVFTVEGGFEVWAGKSSENNDLLTMKHARPNDLWFHARGAGGSHVVLRSGTGKGEISRKAKEQAASIAAYYSKMRNARLVPVAMTERKYVRKPKGAPSGTVVIEREKTLMVPPSLPAEEKRLTRL